MNKAKIVIPSIAFFALCSMPILLPSNNVSAEQSQNQSSIGFSARLRTSIAISLPAVSPTLKITPSTSGSSGTTSFDVKAYCNNKYGYNLTMYATDSNLTGTTHGGTISTLESSVASSDDIPANHWGFNALSSTSSHESGHFYPIATDSTPFTLLHKDTISSNDGDSVSIDLGAKLDLDTTADTYNTTLNFAIVANTMYMNDISNVEYFRPATLNFKTLTLNSTL